MPSPSIPARSHIGITGSLIKSAPYDVIREMEPFNFGNIRTPVGSNWGVDMSSARLPYGVSMLP